MSRRNKHRVMADINMVPFIDITLILLIIFMVMSPMLVQMQMTVDLPKSNAINTHAEDDVIRIEVQKNGTIRVLNKTVTVKTLERELILRLGKLDGLPKETILREEGNEPHQGIMVIQSPNSSAGTDTFANYEAFWFSSL